MESDRGTAECMTRDIDWPRGTLTFLFFVTLPGVLTDMDKLPGIEIFREAVAGAGAARGEGGAEAVSGVGTEGGEWEAMVEGGGAGR